MTELTKELDTSKYFDVESFQKVTSAEECQYLGMTVNKTSKGEIKESDIDRFLIKCKSVVESDIFEGFLMPPFTMDLACYDKRRNLWVNKDGSRFVLSPIDELDKEISNPEDIVHRAMLLMYFKSKIGRFELRDRFGKVFSAEGELPSKW